MESQIYSPSPIREQTAFMAAMTTLRTEYEANLTALYDSQAEYKSSFSLVETVKSFGFGDLDYMKLNTSFSPDSLRMSVDVNPGDVETLYKALKITGVEFNTRLSAAARRLFIEVPGYPKLTFMAHPVMDIIEVTACSA